MAVTTLGISLQPEALEQLDELALQEGLARSAMIARLVEAEQERKRLARRRGGGLEVVVDGVRYVPAGVRTRKAT